MRSDLPINNLEKILSTLNSSLFLSQKVGVDEEPLIGKDFNFLCCFEFSNAVLYTMKKQLKTLNLKILKSHAVAQSKHDEDALATPMFAVIWQGE